MRRRVSRVGRPKAGTLDVEAETVILEKALDLFAERSFDRVTTSEIAKATGFNTALIYYYFGNKEELFRRSVALAVERAFATFRLSRRESDGPQQQILGWIDTHIREFDTIAKLIKLSIDYASRSERKPGIDRAIMKFYDDESAVLRQAITNGMASGEFRKVDADETATFISTYLDGVFMRVMILKDFKPVPALKSLKTFVRAHLCRADRSVSSIMDGRSRAQKIR
ncbi:MAG: TetR/AcrR family transcriptional regulator [Hyphomicrobium sp.]|nr:TetR/AcrR family transcriptional regulator [Hyphomicrobium sp.]